MTKQEAIAEIQKGNKVTHLYFSTNEWMTMVNGKILLEDGVQCSQNEFWHWRQDDCWNDGYSLYNGR